MERDELKHESELALVRKLVPIHLTHIDSVLDERNSFRFEPSALLDRERRVSSADYKRSISCAHPPPWTRIRFGTASRLRHPPAHEQSRNRVGKELSDVAIACSPALGDLVNRSPELSYAIWARLIHSMSFGEAISMRSAVRST